jgi:DNA polymerase
VRLFPLYHPAAALYTPSMLEILKADFRRIPELLALEPPPQPELPPPAQVEPAVVEEALPPLAASEPEPEAPEPEPEPDAIEAAVESEAEVQLGLF